MQLINAIQLVLSHYRAGRMDDAGRLCRSILAQIPAQAECLQFLAVLEGAASPHRGEAILRRVMRLAPEMADAYGNLGLLLQRQGRIGAAEAVQKRAMALTPERREHFINLSVLHLARADQGAAITCLRRALCLCPDDVLACVNLGVALLEAHKADKAVGVLKHAAMLAPDNAEGLLYLAHALRETGDRAGSLAFYRRALSLAPERSDIAGYYLFQKQTCCEWDGYDELCRGILDIIDRDAGVVIPLATLSIDTTPAQQHRSAVRFYKDVVARADAGPAASSVPASVAARRPLRIAYFSADFHEHATAYLAAELFELHDRARFEVMAYSYGPEDGSAIRKRLVQSFDRFIDARTVSQDVIARHVSDQKIDILIDLKGYTKQARLDLLARRLAPVQVSYLGYPGTIGSPCMDYIIGDRFVTPAEHQSFYSERLVILPDSYQVNDRRRPLGGRVPARADCGLPDDGVVFSAFNTAYKITPTMFAAWMRILVRTPGSVLWLFEANAEAAANLRREAASRGVDPSRLVFAPLRPLADHLPRYRLADLCLDTLPYNGHTTTSDALWMGCPVVTLIGNGFASRVAASLLNSVGMPETITSSLEMYEETAVRLARDPMLRQSLRRRLENNRLSSALFDSRRFTRHLEQAYDTMWKIHSSGRPPAGFTVAPLPSGSSTSLRSERQSSPAML